MAQRAMAALPGMVRGRGQARGVVTPVAIEGVAGGCCGSAEAVRGEARRRAGSGVRVEDRDAIRAAQVLLAIAGIAVALTAIGLAGLARLDEASLVQSELREAGYAVAAVEPLRSGTFPDNDGRPVAVPDGARVYRVAYRSAAGEQKAGYRVVKGAVGGWWSFPEGR